MRKPIQFLLFLSSYVPLFLICAVAQNDNDVLGAYSLLSFKVLSLVLFGLAIFGVVAAYALVAGSKNMASTRLHITSLSRDSKGTLAYLITYLAPFVSLNFDGLHALSANIMLLCLIGLLYVQSDMVYLNPTLGLFGYQAYRIRIQNSANIKMLLARRIPSGGAIISVKASLVGKGVYIKHD